MNNLGINITTLADAGVDSQAAILAKRPYIATEGRLRGHSVIAVNSGKFDDKGNPVYVERAINTNATLRKDEWIRIDDAVIESARERLVIIEDMRAKGLTFNVGGLGVMTSEWEASSEMTDATATMDGETNVDGDRQEFNLQGVPIPVIQKPFRIGERVLLASRTRGASLDTTMGTEAARAVARTSESMVFNGLGIKSDNYSIYGLNNFPGRETFSISDWADDTVTPEAIFAEMLQMVQKMETEQRHYGPFSFYIPGDMAFQFRRDFKANGDRTLMERCLAEPSIDAVRTADMQTSGNVSMVEMNSGTLDLAVASDVSTVQWASPSGWTNYFQVFAAWAPRFKTDFDGRTGILHATVA